MTTKIKYILTCIILLRFCISVAHSFEGYEHRYVGDKAFVIATDMFGIKCSISNNEEWSKSPCSLYFDNGVLRDSNEENSKYSGLISYGEIVERIDFMLSPTDMFAQRGDVKNYPLSTSDLNPNFFGSHAKPIRNYFRASHNNDAHFQSLLLASQRDWHQRALAVSRECIEQGKPKCDKFNLLGALIVNAASDHYLQDYFAPGHIASARYNTPDIIALSIHDVVNFDGAEFKIKHIDELKKIIDFIKENNYPEKYGINKTQIDKLETQPNMIYLHGDGYLKKSPLQVAYMIIVEVQSILEIYASSVGKNNSAVNASDTGKSLFNEYRWQYHNAELKKASEAEIRYGAYDLDAGVNAHNGIMLNLSLGRETLALSDETQHRTSSNIDIYALLVMGSPDYSRDINGKSTNTRNIAIRLGLSYLDDENYRAFGPRIMLSYDFPLLESRVGGYLRSLRYQSTGISEYEMDYGVMYELGFSLFKTNVSFGRGWGVTDLGELEQGNYFAVGFTFSFPLSRAWGLKRVERIMHARHKKPFN